MEYVFVYANGGWWLKLSDADQLIDYHKKTDGSRYEKALRIYMDEGHPYDILEKLSLEDRIKRMNDIHFNRLYAAVIQAESGEGTILDGFRWLNMEIGMKEWSDIRKYGAVYVNRVGGSTHDLAYTQFCRRKELVYPNFTLEDIRIKRFEGGRHYYAYVGDMQIRNGEVQKWNTYAEAYRYAQRIVQGAEEA